MISKTIKIGDLLIIKLNTTEEVYANIINYFPNTLETKDDYNYEIFYNKVNEIPIEYKIKNGNIVYPFRNSKYIVNKINNTIVAYAEKQEHSDAHVITRENYLINLIVKNDKTNKNLIRLINELQLRILLEKKYFPVHASCVVNDGEATLYFGKKGSGKSTALLSSVLLLNSYPLSNDITFIGKERDEWRVFGTSYDLTFDKSLILQVIENKTSNSNYNFEKYFNSNKLRYSASDFCKSFNTTWIWSSKLNNINFVNLNPNNEFKTHNNIEYNKAVEYLIKYGKDHNFSFDDLLFINNKIPNYEYERISKDIVFNEIEGNIIEHHIKKTLNKQEIKWE